MSGALFVDGRLLRSLAPEITVQWRPDRVVRSVRLGHLEMETVTACPPGATAVVVQLSAKNLGPSSRSVRLGLSLTSRATITGKAWRRAKPPSRSNHLEIDKPRRALAGACRRSGAASVQGVDAECAWLAPNLAEVTLDLPPGGTRRLGFVHALGTSRHDAEDTYDRLIGAVGRAISAAEHLWRAEVANAFEPGTGSFSGSLPVLETESEALRRLYWTGLLGVMIMRRDSPYSKLGRSYDTLLPRYWQTMTFIWDYSLSSVVHALLDPQTMRRAPRALGTDGGPSPLRHRVADRETRWGLVLGQ